MELSLQVQKVRISVWAQRTRIVSKIRIIFVGSEDLNGSSGLDDSNQSLSFSACESFSYTWTKSDILFLCPPNPALPAVVVPIGCQKKVRLYISVNKVMAVCSVFVFVCSLLFLTPSLNASLFRHVSASCLLASSCFRRSVRRLFCSSVLHSWACLSDCFVTNPSIFIHL